MAAMKHKDNWASEKKKMQLHSENEKSVYGFDFYF